MPVTNRIQGGKKGWKKAAAMAGSFLIHWVPGFFTCWVLLWFFNNTAVLLLFFPTFFVVYEMVKARGRYKKAVLSLGGLALLSLLTYSGFLGYMEAGKSPESEKPMISDRALEQAELALKSYHLLESYHVEVDHDKKNVKVKISTTRKVPHFEAVQVGETYAQVLADDFGGSAKVDSGFHEYTAELWNHWNLEITVGPGFLCDYRGEKKRGEEFHWQGPLTCPERIGVH